MVGHNTSSSSRDKYNKYSDVDNRKTPMPEEDITQVTEGWAPYFQSSNSFRINEVLRNMEDGQSLEDAFTGRHEKNLATVLAMDRNMLPLNKDIQVARMAAEEYLSNIMLGAGFTYRDVQAAIDGDQSVINKMNAKLAGTIIKEKQFMSTSHKTNEFDWAFRDRPLKMNINANAGTHAMFNPTRSDDNESEMVFARGTGHKLLKFYYEHDLLQVKVETIPQTKMRKRR